MHSSMMHGKEHDAQELVPKLRRAAHHAYSQIREGRRLSKLRVYRLCFYAGAKEPNEKLRVYSRVPQHIVLNRFPKKYGYPIIVVSSSLPPSSSS